MTDSEMRVTLAKICGWTEIEWYDGDNSGPGYWHGIPPITIGIDYNGEWEIKKDKYGKELPNYLEDLNAIYDAEEKLTDSQRYTYYNQLIIIAARKAVSQKDHKFALIHTTARQRAEAILRSLGKWID